MEYRIAKGFRIFIVIFSALCVLGAIFCFTKAFSPSVTRTIVLSLIMAVFFAVGGVLLCCYFPIAITINPPP